jgi:UDP-N-acetylglucosamine 2-epimerase (non-hydrolysing)
MRTALLVYGTRPEAIKFAPIVRAMKGRPDRWRCVTCVTGQHRQMLDQINRFFGVTPDFDLALMQPNQTLASLSSLCLDKLMPVLAAVKPDIVLVQGDTTTAFIGALASFYARIPCGHVEAGLRTGDRYSPFPEELNRSLIGRLAEYHFAPTQRAVDALRRENIVNNVFLTYNTVVDALMIADRLIEEQGAGCPPALGDVDWNKRVILVTGHRRESFGEPFEAICRALARLAAEFEEVEIVYPVHLNPNVQEPVRRLLGKSPRVHLLPPVDYPDLVWLLKRCHFVVTDSGGIQEEAPSFGKPVLVMRNVTERLEAVEAGVSRLVGNSEAGIFSSASELLRQPDAYQRMVQHSNPYGDGKASGRILDAIESTGRNR